MKRRLFCLALSMVMLSSSMIVSASELPTESEVVNETVQEEPDSAQDIVLPADDSDVKPEATALPEESPSSETEQPESTPEEISTTVTDEDPAAQPEEIPEAAEDEPDAVPAETPEAATEEDGAQEDMAEDGSQESEPQTDDELLGDQIEINGADDQNNAVSIDLETEYASSKKNCWYKFTTKNEPAYYRLWMKNASTKSGYYRIYFYDGRNRMFALGAWENGSVDKILKLEENHTYYYYADASDGNFYYLFGVNSFDDPEGDTAEDSYVLALSEEYRTTMAVSDDVDYYKIQTDKAGHYRIKLVNESVNSDMTLELTTRFGEKLDRKNWIGKGQSSDICLTLDGNTNYYIKVSGYGAGNYCIKAEYLTDNEGDTKETAYSLAEGSSYSTDLCARDDVDFYRLTPSMTSKYVFNITNHNSSGSKSFKLYSERDEVLKSGYVSGERTEKFEIDLTAGNVYYLSIKDQEGKYTLSYKLKFPFTDVPLNSDNWKFKAVNYVNEAGVMTGVSDTLFSPDTALTRAQFASILYRMAGEPYVSHKNVFYDVPAGQWYSKAVIWAYDKKIVAGYSNGYFGIKDPITREQVARMLYLYSEWKGKDVSARANLSGFPDGGQVSGWARSQVEWAVGMNMLSGKTVNGRLSLVPKGQATRAECASMISRYLEGNK